MEEDFFLKNMKGVKPFKKDSPIIRTKTTIKKNVKLDKKTNIKNTNKKTCLLYTSPSPRDATLSRMPSSA